MAACDVDLNATLMSDAFKERKCIRCKLSWEKLENIMKIVDSMLFSWWFFGVVGDGGAGSAVDGGAIGHNFSLSEC